MLNVVRFALKEQVYIVIVGKCSSISELDVLLLIIYISIIFIRKSHLLQQTRCCPLGEAPVAYKMPEQFKRDNKWITIITFTNSTNSISEKGFKDIENKHSPFATQWSFVSLPRNKTLSKAIYRRARIFLNYHLNSFPWLVNLACLSVKSFFVV